MTFRTLVAIVMASAAVVVAEEQTAPTSVFTEQQAETGKAAYTKNCASCHQPQLAGESFMGTWGNKTTKDLRDYMSAAMPYGGPSLDPDTYTSITAFILSSNGAVAGTEKLSALTAVPIGTVTAKRPVAKR
jgi:mono/diheme cytochrome c family protein